MTTDVGVTPASVLSAVGAWWSRTPLYQRILGGIVLGVITGLILQEKAAVLAIPSKLVLRLLGALAPPLILVAIVHALLTTQIEGKVAFRLGRLLLLNTLVAICIGLLVANVVRPGNHELVAPSQVEQAAKPDPLAQFLDNVPRSLLGPLTDDGKVLGVIFIALALGIALRREREHQQSIETVVSVALRVLITILHWIIAVVPIAVFGIVASMVGDQGVEKLKPLVWFVVAVIAALILQGGYYLIRIRFGSWVRPLELIRVTRDALVMAFSTASSTATMPLTYSRLRRLGLRERSASLGSLVGANFNNDGTALYEAMAALFIAQMTGIHLDPWQQVLVVVTSVAASVGAAGIPEAGLVTMTLVFNAVGLDIHYIPILLTVDWFLDRCRTTINVMGDMNVSCLLDGKQRETEPLPAALAAV